MSYWPEGMKVDPIAEWPGPMTVDRRRAPFGSTLTTTKAELDRELRALRAENVRLQIAIPAGKWRVDGFPRSDARPEHPGVILTLMTEYGALSYPCDTFSQWEQNLRAITLSLEALRKVARYGVTKRGEQYRGNLAIEAFAMSASEWDDTTTAMAFVLERAGLHHDVLLTVGGYKSAFRRAKFRTHPDTITDDNDPGDYDRVVAAEQYINEKRANR